MTKKKPAKGVVRAWGLENKKTGELYNEAYQTHDTPIYFDWYKDFMDLWKIVPVKIIKEAKRKKG